MRIAVGSRNPAKVEPVREVAALLFPGAEVVAVDAASGVSDQPLSDAETLRGARERARAALERTGAQVGVGIEGGLDRVEGVWMGFTWAAVLCADGRAGVASSARFPLPERIASAIRAGAALGPVVAEMSGVADVSLGDGAMGLLTGGHVTRRSATVQALHFAFAPLTGAVGWWKPTA